MYIIYETQTVTTPHDHFFVANELNTHNIMITSMAPRFCGEFQKGIDYIGDIDLFNKEYHYIVSIKFISDKKMIMWIRLLISQNQLAYQVVVYNFGRYISYIE